MVNMQKFELLRIFEGLNMKHMLVIAYTVAAMLLAGATPSLAHGCWPHHHHHHWHWPVINYVSVLSPEYPYYYYSPYSVVHHVLVHEAVIILPKD